MNGPISMRSAPTAASRITSRPITSLGLICAKPDKRRAIRIDGQDIKAKPEPRITLVKNGAAWKLGKRAPSLRLHKTHALQGPIDDAFLDPFLLVRPTGTPWNAAVNEQALRTLAHFDSIGPSISAAIRL